MADGAELQACGEALDFPVPTLQDFDDDIPVEERNFCIARYTDLNKVKQVRMHCTACNKHLGLSAHNVNRLKMHPLLRTLICIDCLEFYNSGEFSKGEDGSELYCRWCGQGGQVYCCASCPVVFCENCIKRNFGAAKIEDIESIDDWNCFICNPKGLWCHRAALWAARRYCKVKNEMTQTAELPMRRLQLQRECQIDESACCKRKSKLTTPQNKSTPKENKTKVNMKRGVVKDVQIPIPIGEVKKPMKRQGSPFRQKKISSQSVPQSILANLPSTLSVKAPSSVKKIASSQLKSTRMPYAAKISALNKKMYSPSSYKPYNGFLPTTFSSGPQDYYANVNDHLNLSLESLTQGLDVSNLHNPNISSFNDDSVVCTPDFPLLEPMCEVNEDVEGDCAEIVNSKADDDVQCLTPKIMPKPLSALTDPVFPPKNLDLNPNNIIQMTEKDVTVNRITGGLKFRVDPATLSTNKMYQLPDGRIFAVNINPKMPGGYSATIVTLTEKSSLNTRPNPLNTSPINIQQNEPSILESSLSSRLGRSRANHSWTKPYVAQTNDSPKVDVPKNNKAIVNKTRSRAQPPSKKTSSIEWYSYNLCDAIDLMQYVSKRLDRLKETPKSALEGKTLDEVRELHYTFDQMLKISSQRFSVIRKNVTLDYNNWLKEMGSSDTFREEESDNIAITPNEKSAIRSSSLKRPINSDEPIFIDENSEDSFKADDKTANHSVTNHSDDTSPNKETTATYELSKELMSIDESDDNSFDNVEFEKSSFITIRRISDKTVVEDPIGDVISSITKRRKLGDDKMVDIHLTDDINILDVNVNNDESSSSNLECNKNNRNKESEETNHTDQIDDQNSSKENNLETDDISEVDPLKDDNNIDQNSSEKNNLETNDISEVDPLKDDDIDQNSSKENNLETDDLSEADLLKDDDAVKNGDSDKDININADIDPLKLLDENSIDNIDELKKSLIDDVIENSICADVDMSTKPKNAVTSNVNSSEEDGNTNLIKNCDKLSKPLTTDCLTPDSTESDMFSKATDNGKEDSSESFDILKENDKNGECSVKLTADQNKDDDVEIVPENTVTVID